MSLRHKDVKCPVLKLCVFHAVKLNLLFMYKQTNAHLWRCSAIYIYIYIYIYSLLFFTPTWLGLLCDHLQSVTQYKYQEYNRTTCQESPQAADKNRGGFYRAFYVISILLLVWLLQDTLKMVTQVTEICECSKKKKRYISELLHKCGFVSWCIYDKNPTSLKTVVWVRTAALSSKSLYIGTVPCIGTLWLACTILFCFDCF
jgi:hypothetical protein